MRLSKNKKAISPLIATIILIAITIAGGLVVYALFTSTASVASAKAQVQIDSMDLVKTSTGTVFTITVKNTGNKPLATAASSLTVSLGSETGNPFDMTPATALQPGQSTSITLSSSAAAPDTLTGTYVIGDSYLVSISATYSDGSTSSLAQSIMCSG